LRSLALKHPGILVPRLIMHDSRADILALSDLGDLPTMWQWFMAANAPSEHAASTAGRAVGDFIGAVEAETLQLSPTERSFFKSQFRNRSAEDALVAVTFNTLSSTFLSCDVSDGLLLGEFLLKDWHQSQSDDVALCFSHADFWIPNLLVDESHDDVLIGIIDWEFASFQRPGFDMARLVAYLYLLAQSSLTPAASLPALRAFTSAALNAYTERVPLLSESIWNARVKASFAVNLCNGAIRHPWCACVSNKEGQWCEHVRDMVREAAAWARASMDCRDDISWPGALGNLETVHVTDI